MASVSCCRTPHLKAETEPFVVGFGIGYLRCLRGRGLRAGFAGFAEGAGTACAAGIFGRAALTLMQRLSSRAPSNVTIASFASAIVAMRTKAHPRNSPDLGSVSR